MASDEGPIIVVEYDESVVATGNSQLSRLETPRLGRQQHRPNNTDGRNNRHPENLGRLEEALQEDESISAVYDQSVSARGVLFEIRKRHMADLCGSGAPTRIYDLATEAIAMHAQIQQLCGTIANDMKRKRKELTIVRKRLRTQEIQNEWNEWEAFRLRQQLDAVFDINRSIYEKINNALQEDIDHSDAASSASARPSDNCEEGGTSSGEPSYFEVVRNLAASCCGHK